ncbi:hypothetical protein [Blastococcus xanthinilyticus]|uniref:DUF892 family protein n=1 Tax=Blastococcus xanthinilyticus TaxID=1564164 RepID=A0A5S5D2T6_9ACTN|nr:hypothetical protein [Blastococcus xanthinilyticus]TYP90300.1 hypothetical protein BD833_10118 [Blastococcus xanthinilyticus]
MKLDLAIEELHRSENHLAGVLLAMSDRHKADHEVFHVARDIARWSQDHVQRLAAAGQEFGLDLDPEPKGDPTVLEKARQKASDLMGRSSAPGLLLLADLRHVYREASGVSLDWELLAQAAQGARKQELLQLAKRCHPDTLRQVRWANGKLKESATQVLVG